MSTMRGNSIKARQMFRYFCRLNSGELIAREEKNFKKTMNLKNCIIASTDEMSVVHTRYYRLSMEQLGVHHLIQCKVNFSLGAQICYIVSLLLKNKTLHFLSFCTKILDRCTNSFQMRITRGSNKGSLVVC